MLEVCVNSLESAINAIHGGADELEVCSTLNEGGLTPSPGLVKQIVEMVKNLSMNQSIRKSCTQCNCINLSKVPKVNVMIRCRAGSDFCYTDMEIDVMLIDIEIFKSMGVDRFVFGALNDSQYIDINSCKKVAEKACPIPLTFHRAFDLAAKPFDAMEEIIKLGFTRLLTSGQQDSADDVVAINLIRELIKKFGDKIEIMPGAGVKEDNAKVFIDLGCKIVHSSCKNVRRLPISKFHMGSNDVYVTDENIVRRIKAVINLPPDL